MRAAKNARGQKYAPSIQTMVCWSLVALILLVIVLMYNSARRAASRAGPRKGSKGKRRSGFEGGTQTPYCNQVTHACVGCVEDIDCPTGICDPTTNSCTQCSDTNVSKCPEGLQQCDKGTCQACKTVNGQHIGCGPGQVCSNGRCVECAFDVDCPTAGYNGAPGVCAAGVCGECRFDENGVAIGCPADLPYCGQDGKCRACLGDGTGCGGDKPYCYTGNDAPRSQCVACRTWSDCASETQATPPEVLCGPHGKFNPATGACECAPEWADGDKDPSRPMHCRVCAPGRGPRGDCSKDIHTNGIFSVKGGASDYDDANWCFNTDVYTYDGKGNEVCIHAFGPNASTANSYCSHDDACDGNTNRYNCVVPTYYTDHGVDPTAGSYGQCNLNGPDSDGNPTTLYPPGFQPF